MPASHPPLPQSERFPSADAKGANGFSGFGELEEALTGFVPPKAAFVPSGQNCNCAWYLKATGARKSSLPFDWIFSSPQILAHCLRDDFRVFLDRTFIEPTDSGAAGHARYHARLFAHRSPLADAEAYRYYERCVDRFRALFRSEVPLVFISTMLPEHGKRRAWADGFRYEFKRPANQDPEREYAAFQHAAALRPGPTRLVAVRQVTEAPLRRVRVIGRSETLLAVEFQTCGSNNGAHYRDPGDDACCRRLYEAICRSS